MDHRCTGFKASVAVKAAIAAILVFTLSAVTVAAKEETRLQEELVAGTVIVPPFAMKRPSGEWEGLSIGLLALVAREMGIDFRLQEYGKLSIIIMSAWRCRQAARGAKRSTGRCSL